jgi:cytochrome c-type biogenesis protein CcmH/NrfG
VKATLLYTLARLGIFVVLFAVLRLTPLSVYLAAAVAAIMALVLSYIFLGRLRRGVAENIARRRAAPERDDDADEEDAVLDGSVAAVRPAPSRRAAPPAEDE